MKILVVCQYYYPEPFRISDICEALAARGHSVTVVTGLPNYPEGKIYPGYEQKGGTDEERNGVKIHRCPLIPRKTGALYRFLNYYSFVFSSVAYLRTLKEEFDVVFCNQLSPVMMAEGATRWAKKHKKKCVLYCLDLWPDSLLMGGIRLDSIIYKVFLRISRRIYRNADRILVSSHGFLPYFDEVLRIPEDKMGYLPQYAEGLFDTVASSEEEKNTVDFLFAGNVGNLQSMETVVEAARLLKDEPSIRLHIVGGGISLDKCKELAADLTNITFYGRRDLSEMPQFYGMADVMMISLVKDPSMSMNMPGKVQSYMAAGKPIAGCIDGETARIIREADCGMCSKAEDAAGFAEVLRTMAAQRSQRKLWGENARAYYDAHFRKEVFIRDLERILESECQ